MDTSSTSVRKAREVYRIKELRTVFPKEPNDSIGDEPKAVETDINVSIKFSVLTNKRNGLGMEYCIMVFVK